MSLRRPDPESYTDTRTPEVAAAPAVDPTVLGWTVLLHPDPERIGERAVLSHLAAGRGERLSRLEPRFALPGAPPGAEPRSLEDPYLSRSPLLITPLDPGGGRPVVHPVVRLDAGSTRTPIAVDGEPLGGSSDPGVDPTLDLTPDRLAAGVVVRLGERVVLVLSPVDPGSAVAPRRHGLVGESPALVRLRQEIDRVAPLEVPVLLRGETGTGKELVARALHRASGRRSGPFEAVNLGAVPPNLAAAELFGVAKGAYTGADRRRQGFFQRADRGTLFLDEIGEASPEVQALLLRALESGEVQPVGGEGLEHPRVRVVSATDANLEAGLARGSFKAPLLHRLAGWEIRLPPLRERREDLGRLLVHLIRRELAAQLDSPLDSPLDSHGRRGPSPAGSPGELAPNGSAAQPFLPARLMERLALHPWPGNVRELANVARRLAVGLGRGSGRSPGDLGTIPAETVEQLERLLERSAAGGGGATAGEPSPPEGPAGPSGPGHRGTGASGSSYRDPDSVGDEELVEALRQHRFHIRNTARFLGLSPTSLYERIDRHPDLRKASELEADEIRRALEAAGGDPSRAAQELGVSRRGLARRMGQLGIEP